MDLTGKNHVCGPGFAVLLKGEKSDCCSDPYIDKLKELAIKASIIPVLAFNFINKQVLQNALQNGDKYSGIIFTSTRAVEAVHQAVQGLIGNYLEQWQNKLNFAVGTATHNAAKSILNIPTRGEDAGNSEKLSRIILNTCPVSSLPFLFPCSNIRKETIPSTLQSQGIAIEEVISYETVMNPNLKECWDTVTQTEGVPEILVFFSPSGVHFALNMLHSLDQGILNFKFVAIGPSTRDALYQAGITPWLVSAEPNPESLYEAFKCKFQSCSAND